MEYLPIQVSTATTIVYGEELRGQDAVWESYFTMAKSFNTSSESFATTHDDIAETSTESKSYTAGYNPGSYAFGVIYMKRFFKDRWISVYGGIPFAVTYYSSGSAKTGSSAKTAIADDDKKTYLLNESNYGEVKKSWTWGVDTGVRIAAEFYIRHLPHLAIGLSATGLTGYKAPATTTTSTRTRTVQVNDGEEEDPTVDNTSEQITKTRPGIGSYTYTVSPYFQVLGAFTLRYIF